MVVYVGGDPPAEYPISVTKGFDKKFTLRRHDENGDPVNWDATVFIDIDIDRSNPTRVQATVTDDMAVFRIESLTCDSTKNNMAWRIGISQPETPTLETPLMVGYFERKDGGRVVV